MVGTSFMFYDYTLLKNVGHIISLNYIEIMSHQNIKIISNYNSIMYGKNNNSLYYIF